MRYLLISIFSLALAVASCERPAPSPARTAEQPNTAPSRSPVAPSGPLSPGAIDACSLVTPAEVEAVIGEKVVNTQPSGKSDGGLDIAQCYVAATTAANSVSLVVIQKAAVPGARDPKEFWAETFGSPAHADDDDGRERTPPQKIEELGDEAFWIGSPIGSALYVLKANTYLRVSVGGSNDQAAKLEKCKSIARLMLQRL